MTDTGVGEHCGPLRFLTLHQVAEELNTKDSTIRGLIQSGELPALQIGGRGQWRIERTKWFTSGEASLRPVMNGGYRPEQQNVSVAWHSDLCEKDRCQRGVRSFKATR